MNNYQSAWQEKANLLPDEIFSRINPAVLTSALKLRAFISGPGAELFLPRLANTKVFLVNPLAPPPEGHTATVLKGEPLTKLGVFPPETFHLVVSLWDIQTKPAEAFKTIYKSLKKTGFAGIVTLQDNAPKVPLNIFKSILRRHRDWSLRMFESELPPSKDHLRAMLDKSGFGDVRVWKDAITCDYKTAQDVYDELTQKTSGLFRDEILPAVRNTIRQEFLKEMSSQSLQVKYDFLGAVCRK
ncbi:MAG: hypothetical protein WC980_02790 [Candidatus Brocadiia bacterium]